MRLIVILLMVTFFSLNGEEKKLRVVSLAPSITEIICALEQQNRLVGVTDFCHDPFWETDFKGILIGGIINPNLEKILRLKPDLVLVLKSKGEEAKKLEKVGLKVIEVDHMSLSGVMESIKVIGELCGEKEKGENLYLSLKKKLEFKEKTDAPKVLITVSRLANQGNVKLWVAGDDDFYGTLLQVCGAKNAFAKKAKFEEVSLEYLVKLNPDVIFLIRDKMSEEEERLEKEFWQRFSTLKAVKNKQFHIITGDEMMIPGPRFPSIIEKFQKILNTNE